VPFIPRMLCSRLEGAARFTDPRYVAEPTLDGQRAQLHVREGRTAYLFSRPGRDLLRHHGMAWLREITWPGILDGEACAGDGHEGIQAVFEEWNMVGDDRHQRAP
jgi:ATP-dependent DNA ligase